MPKVEYDNIKFDSELEVEYYKYLENLEKEGIVQYFVYHPCVPIKITKNNTYTPDFVVYYTAPDGVSYERCEIIETKGYNPYSKMRDDMIHQVMLSKTKQELREWLGENETNCYNDNIIYRKIKYLKAYGFVDWDFKNPNTIANKRKEKINEQKDEIKELKDFKKDAERYFRYHLKLVYNKKLTKAQREWYYKYVEFLKENYMEETNDL